MKVLIAPDSFKGSLPAIEAAAALAKGVERALAELSLDGEVDQAPMADGGEGTLAALAEEIVEVRVPGLGGGHHAAVGLRSRPGGGVLGLVEVAQGVGLPSVPDEERDPWAYSSRPVAALLGAVLDEGAQEVWVGLGGTATVDGGAGLLAGLGARLLDDAGRELDPAPRAWAERLECVDLGPARSRVGGAPLLGLSDVRGPLLGPRGARAYMRQKGVAEGDLDRLEDALARFAQASGAPDPLSAEPGAGAAGGLGYALLLLGGELRSGADKVAEALDLRRRAAAADLVITGEGRFDLTSLDGKATGTVLALGREGGARLAVACGAADAEAGLGDDLLVEEIGRGRTLAEAIAEAPALLEQAGARLIRAVAGGA